MLRSTVAVLLAAGLIMAQDSGSSRPVKAKGAEARRPAAAKPAARDTRLTLPKDAVQVEPYTWRWTDKDGKTWTYRQTPFGLVRFEQPAGQAEQSPGEHQPGLEAFEEGDRVRFERMTPFGRQRWYRDKGELSEEERRALERSRSAGGGPAPDKKPDRE